MPVLKVKLKKEELELLATRKGKRSWRSFIVHEVLQYPRIEDYVEMALEEGREALDAVGILYEMEALNALTKISKRSSDPRVSKEALKHVRSIIKRRKEEVPKR